jgi:hypothetical protein
VKKENIVAQTEPTIHNVNFKLLPELHDLQQLEHYRQQQNQSPNARMEHLIQLIRIVVLTLEEREDSVAQMEPTIQSARLQQPLGQPDLHELVHQLKLQLKDLLEVQLEGDQLKLPHIFHLKQL